MDEIRTHNFLIDRPACYCWAITALSSPYNTLQLVYREAHLTETALLKIFDYLLSNVDVKKLIVIIVLNITAAFNTSYYLKLLKRLQEEFVLAV